jgi:glycosyltransferase involved in cell wall biosynthesis
VQEKKKILVFIDWFLPGYKAGGPVQSCANLIAHLKDFYDFSVVTRDTDYCEETPYKGITSDEWTFLPDGTRIYYISKNKLYRNTIKQILKSEEFDILYLNGVYSLYFTLIPLYYMKRLLSLRLDMKSSGKMVVVAARGMLADSAIAVKKTKKKIFIHSANILNLFNNVVFHATNETEASQILQNFGKIKVRIAPNLPRNLDISAKIRQKETGILRLVNVARISPEKNLGYAIEVLANVKSKVILDVFGPVYDQQYWNECQKKIAKLPPNVKVQFKGSIPGDQLLEVFQSYDFLILPSRGENFGHVIFESMIMGCPVIISDRTPWKNLQERSAGWDIPLTEPHQFAAVIEKCAGMSEAEYQFLSDGAYSFAKSFANKEELISKNISLFKN